MTLVAGEAAPWFTARSTNNPKFHIDTAAGRYLVLCFLGSAASPAGRIVAKGLAELPAVFDDVRASFFAISADPDDERLERLRQRLPGLRCFWDFDRAVSRLYGAATEDGGYLPQSVVLDLRLRVVATLPIVEGADHFRALAALISRLPEIPPVAPASAQAPVLVVPGVFEPAFCRRLIALAEMHGVKDSGFMREIDGRTVGVVDYSHKRRADHMIEDEAVRDGARRRIVRRLVPEIEKAFQFAATRMERYVVACYDSSTGGYFRPHRDNTTKGTAHRRFAVTINLNAEEYEGGDLRFPEFGRTVYRAETGGAVVFSCSLLHEVSPMVRGRRYAFLPFLYDEAAAEVRMQNRGYLGEAIVPEAVAEDGEGIPAAG